ncbi:hypothetical protein DFP72DRAFT_204582 [Ephemerocybe angulata]|uniref:Ricin B lectin domain-containing protein n=1 Tax=Ephemerocybe angulata TaxID=980116 RepID=A0A8H6IH39_9AGAR|nr:hypothetical protein DFP72DRAFT_204582 [Tulosesus angulatus]
MPVEAGPGEQLLESGRTYKFANVKTGSALTIHPTTRRVFGNHYIASKLQLWVAASKNGFWTFKNSETGRYLGFDVGVVAKNGRHVVATANAFAWAIVREDSEKGWMKLFVPYTNQCLDLDANGGWANGITIQSVAAHNNHCGKWVIDPDTTFEPIAMPGELYKLLNYESKTVCSLRGAFERRQTVSGFRYNEGRNQKWEAIPSGSGTWFVRNHFDGLYMGIKGTIAEIGSCVVGTEAPFAWDIAPRYKEGRRREPNGAIVYVPNTELALCIENGSSSPGAKLKLWADPIGWSQYWVFEKVECLTQCQEHLQRLVKSIRLSDLAPPCPCARTEQTFTLSSGEIMIASRDS